MEQIIALFKIYKRPIIIVAIVVFALSVPLVVSQVLKNQDIRQHADTAPAVKIVFDPLTKTLNLNDTFDLKISINTNTNDISAVDGYLQYDHTLFTLTSVTPGTDYTQVPMPSTTPAAGLSANITQQEYVFVNKTVNPKIGPTINPATFHFTAKAAGTGTITFGSLTSTQNPTLKLAASKIAASVPSESPGATGIYTITDQSVSPTIATTNLTPTTTPQKISCSSENTSITFNMKSPYSVAADGPISSIKYVSGEWCAWSSSDTLNYAKCPVKCHDPSQLTLSADKKSIYFDFDTHYADNSGSCTYSITCSNASTTITPTVTATPTPTKVPTPTPTLAPNETRVKLSVLLPGIGIGSGDNANPQHSTKDISVQIFNSSDQKVFDSSSTLVYSTVSGEYIGITSLGTSFVTGSYYIKVKMANTLWKRLPGIVEITKGSDQNVAQPATLVSGDMDGDNKLTIQDYNAVVSCFKAEAACTEQVANLSDINDNGKAKDDLLDFVILRTGFATREGD
jgi:hypothetical protein